VIFFEGTYTATFSAASEKTPRYDYNQIMYRLRLDDARLALPAPVYLVRRANGTVRWMMSEAIEAEGAWDQIGSVPFFAVPPDRRHEGLMPVYSVASNGSNRLQGPPINTQQSESIPLFLALPATNAPPLGAGHVTPEPHDWAIVPLYEYRHRQNDQRLYSTQPAMNNAEWQRAPEPLCRVWRNPTAFLTLDRAAKPRAARPR
jgi:hypothetical protein